jgi:hypothetical protein
MHSVVQKTTRPALGLSAVVGGSGKTPPAPRGITLSSCMHIANPTPQWMHDVEKGLSQS